MNTKRTRGPAAAAAAILVVLAAAAGPAFAGDEGTGLTGQAKAVGARGTGVPEIAGLAEYHLSTLAASSRRSRHLAGGLGLAAGALFIGAGLALLHDADGELGGAVVVAMGGLGMAGGILSLATNSAAEIRYARIGAIEDPGLREEASAEALRGLSKKGKRSRTVRAVILGASGLVGALSASNSDGQASNLAAAACGGGLAALSLLFKSRAEKTYQAYLEKRGLGINPEIILSAGPRGGIRAGLSMDF